MQTLPLNFYCFLKNKNFTGCFKPLEGWWGAKGSCAWLHALPRILDMNSALDQRNSSTCHPGSSEGAWERAGPWFPESVSDWVGTS